MPSTTEGRNAIVAQRYSQTLAQASARRQEQQQFLARLDVSRADRQAARDRPQGDPRCVRARARARRAKGGGFGRRRRPPGSSLGQETETDPARIRAALGSAAQRAGSADCRRLKRVRRQRQTYRTSRLERAGATLHRSGTRRNMKQSNVRATRSQPRDLSMSLVSRLYPWFRRPLGRSGLFVVVLIIVLAPAWQYLAYLDARIGSTATTSPMSPPRARSAGRWRTCSCRTTRTSSRSGGS